MAILKPDLAAVGVWAGTASAAITAGAVLLSSGHPQFGNVLLYGGLGLLGICACVLVYSPVAHTAEYISAVGLFSIEAAQPSESRIER
jgi:hypothetical protein